MKTDLTRRQALFTIAGTGIAATTGVACGGSASSVDAGTATGADSAAAMCVLTADQLEGPFFVDARMIRQDITEGKEGLLLRLRLRVLDAQSCEPIRDAVTHIWHCDAAGYYSGYPSAMENPPTGADHVEPENDEIWLRGAQVTDADGAVEFRTIYPGWYPGRAAHIHFKVVIGATTVLSSQMYFPEQLTRMIYAEQSPYNARPVADTTNATDGVIRASGGIESSPLLTVSADGEGYLGQLTIGVLRA